MLLSKDTFSTIKSWIDEIPTKKKLAQPPTLGLPIAIGLPQVQPQAAPQAASAAAEVVARESDQCSQHSGDGSNTDSGRGPSEEGDAALQARGTYHCPILLLPHGNSLTTP